MRTLIPYDQALATQKNRRVILQYHIAKSGGTTLAHVLARNTPNLVQLDAENYLQWPALRNAFHDDENVTHLLEGVVWGIENFLPEAHNYYYITMLREPFSIVRSLYNFSSINLTTSISFEEFLEQSENNTITNYLGAGSVQLALERLESFAYFGILERFAESMALLSRVFDIQISAYENKKVSNSKKIAVDEDTYRKYKYKNAKDYYVYETALELFEKRIAPCSDDVALVANTLSTITPSVEAVDNSDQGEQIATLLKEGKQQQLVELLLETPQKGYREMLLLARQYRELQDYANASTWYAKNFTLYPGMVADEYAEFLLACDIDSAKAFFEEQLVLLKSMDTETPSDSIPNRLLFFLLPRLMKACLAMEHFEQAMETASLFIDLLQTKNMPLDYGSVWRNRLGTVLLMCNELMSRLDLPCREKQPSLQDERQQKFLHAYGVGVALASKTGNCTSCF